MKCAYQERTCKFCENCAEFEKTNIIEVEIYQLNDCYVMIRYDIDEQKVYELESCDGTIFRLAGKPYKLNSDIIRKIDTYYKNKEGVKLINSFQINL